MSLNFDIVQDARDGSRKGGMFPSYLLVVLLRGTMRYFWVHRRFSLMQGEGFRGRPVGEERTDLQSCQDWLALTITWTLVLKGLTWLQGRPENRKGSAPICEVEWSNSQLWETIQCLVTNCLLSSCILSCTLKQRGTLHPGVGLVYWWGATVLFSICQNYGLFIFTLLKKNVLFAQFWKNNKVQHTFTNSWLVIPGSP